MGEWPQRRMKMRNKRTARWGLANMSSGERFELAWENITYAEAESLVRVLDLNYGSYGHIALPPEIFAGIDLTELEDLMAAPFPSTSWRFIEPPRVLAVKAGRCTVQVPIGAKALSVQEP